jgi:hypothetical protein
MGVHSIFRAISSNSNPDKSYPVYHVNNQTEQLIETGKSAKYAQYFFPGFEAVLVESEHVKYDVESFTVHTRRVKGEGPEGSEGQGVQRAAVFL